MKTIILISAMLVLGINTVFSQDTLLLLSGKSYSGQITEISKNYIRIYTDRSFINSSKLIYKDEVFSFVKNNETTVLYKPNFNNEIRFSELEMSYFIKGLQDGKKQYHAPFATIGGFAVGATGGVFGFWGTVIPSSYVFIVGIKTPKIENTFQSTENFNIVENTINDGYGLKNYSKQEKMILNNDFYFPYYKSGYETSAKDKKIKNAVKGSVIGFVVFVATSVLILHK